MGKASQPRLLGGFQAKKRLSLKKEKIKVGVWHLRTKPEVVLWSAQAHTHIHMSWCHTWNPCKLSPNLFPFFGPIYLPSKSFALPLNSLQCPLGSRLRRKITNITNFIGFFDSFFQWWFHECDTIVCSSPGCPAWCPCSRLSSKSPGGKPNVL